MRIGLLHPDFTRRGGAGFLTLWLAQGLASRGHEVSLVSAGFEWALWGGPPSGVRLIELPGAKPDGHMPAIRIAGATIARELPEVEVLVAGLDPTHHWLAAAVARMARRPHTVVYCQEPNRKFYFRATDRPLLAYLEGGRRSLPFDEWLRKAVAFRLRYQTMSRAPLVRWHDRRSLRAVDRVVANSRWTAEAVARAWGREAQVCYPGVPRPVGAGPPFADRSGVLVLTGWDLPKNPMGVLGAIREVVEANGRSDIAFTVVGPGRHARYDEYLDRHGLDESVTLIDSLTQTEKVNALMSSRLSLYLPVAEPFGLVPVESMLCGTPVVASDHAGPAEVLRSGVTGELVDPFEPRAIAGAVIRLHDDESHWNSLSSAALAEARADYDLEALVGRFERLLPR